MHILVFFSYRYGSALQSPSIGGTLLWRLHEAPLYKGLCKAPLQKALHYEDFVNPLYRRGFKKPLERGGFIHTYIPTYAHFGLFHTDMAVLCCGGFTKPLYTRGFEKPLLWRGFTMGDLQSPSIEGVSLWRFCEALLYRRGFSISGNNMPAKVFPLV